MNSIIKVENLSKVYKTFYALKDLSLDVMQGDIYGLIGKNGAGKSTLLKAISGIIPATYGSISIQNSQNEQQLRLSRKNMRFFIDKSLFPYLSAYENLSYRCKIDGIQNEKQEILRVLDALKLKNIKKPVKTYSMGMKQRLEIASCLMGYPDIILLDEPLNGLDPEGIHDLKNLIIDINKNYGTTFIISSHILSELEVMSTKFGFLDSGMLIKQLSHEELEDECKQQLIVKADDTKKATIILEQILNTHNYSVNSNNEILLLDYVDEPQKVADALYENGLHLQKLHLNSITLEEFFLKMIGGRTND